MTLYSNDCPNCKTVKNVLMSKDLSFTYVDDYNTVVKKAQEVNIMQMPLLEIDGVIYSGSEAVSKAKEL